MCRVLLLSALPLLSIGCAGLRPPSGVDPVVRRLDTTAYCACRQCCGWKRNWFGLGRTVYASGPHRGEPKKVGITASGGKAVHGTIAADTSRYPFGTIMRIDGYGYGRVEDRGGAIKGDHIDLFFPDHDEALKWGKRRLPVRIWFVPSRRSETDDLEAAFASTDAGP